MVGAYQRYKIQVVSCASVKLHIIMELVHRLTKFNIPRFSEVDGIRGLGQL